MIQGFESGCDYFTAANFELGDWGDSIRMAITSFAIRISHYRLLPKIEVQPLRCGLAALDKDSDCDLMPVSLLARTPKS